MFKPFIRNYFGFNKQQRNGLLMLVCISFILLIILYLLIISLAGLNNGISIALLVFCWINRIKGFSL